MKTDARDAEHLARLLHLGQITDVAVPSVAQEAARDLVRAREDCRGDLMGARQRVSNLLLRQGIVYCGGQPWTGKHEMWLRGQQFGSPALTLAYEAALDAMVACVHRRDLLDEAIAALAADSEFTALTQRLGCLRGISTLTGFGLAVEISDWNRLTGRSIGAYLGLVPCENFSGATRSQGGLTKTGNGHARRLLLEAAWHQRAPYRPGRDIRLRWDAAPLAARERGQARRRTSPAPAKGRRKRATPLTAATVAVLSAYLPKRATRPGRALFCGTGGDHLSRGALEHRLAIHLATAATSCPSIAEKHVTLHTQRHTAAMNLLAHGVESRSSRCGSDTNEPNPPTPTCTPT